MRLRLEQLGPTRSFQPLCLNQINHKRFRPNVSSDTACSKGPCYFRLRHFDFFAQLPPCLNTKCTWAHLCAQLEYNLTLVCGTRHKVHNKLNSPIAVCCEIMKLTPCTNRTAAPGADLLTCDVETCRAALFPQHSLL